MKRLLSFRVIGYLLLPLMGGIADHGMADAAETLSENQVKVAYLYNFTKFVEWPSTSFRDKESPFNLCLLGRDPFEQLLSILTKKTVRGRALSLRYLRHLGEIEGCHLLFIAQAEDHGLSALFNHMDGKPILTVGDVSGFAQQGGMVNFVREQDVLRFEINLRSVRRVGLKMSATMVQIGRIVRE